MNARPAPLLNIPTNLILGFLGSGKTSAIIHLLKQKPAGQIWAVLVNEFGKVGIDGAIFESQGIQVKEVSGGCMCCAAGVSLQVAVNQLLKASRPDRLIIEASGLGHPKRVLDTLHGPHFQKSLALKASICLIDPRNLLDSSYTTHETFIDQIAVSDILLANKTDLASSEALQAFDQLAHSASPAKILADKTRFGQFDAAWLDLAANGLRQSQHPDFHAIPTIQESTNREAYQSHGRVFSPGQVFDYQRVSTLFKSLKAERLKAILHTDRGWFIFNGQLEQILSQPGHTARDNRVELIYAGKPPNDIDMQINACRIDPNQAD